jgi:hypothetical protein
MNKRNYSLFALILIVLLSTFNSCKVKNPTEGFIVTVKADAVSAANVFRIINAKTSYSDKAFEGVTVSVSGPGMNNLYTMDGYKTFKIIDGQVGIGIRKGVMPSPTNPVVFSLTVNINGYIGKTTSYQLTSLLPSVFTIGLTEISNLPSAAKYSDTTFSIGAGGITSSVFLTSPASPEKPEPIKLEIKPGTVFKDAKGNIVSGNIKAEVIHVVPTKADDYKMNLLNPFATNFVDTNGNPKNVFFFPDQFVYLNFTSNGKASLPVYLTFPMIISSSPRSAVVVEPITPPLSPGFGPSGFGGSPYAGGGGYGGVGGGGSAGGLLGLRGLAGSGAIAALSSNNDNQPCPAVAVAGIIDITNFDQFGSFYEFRKVIKNASGAEISTPENIIVAGRNPDFINLPSEDCPNQVHLEYRRIGTQDAWTSVKLSALGISFALTPITVTQLMKVYFAVDCPDKRVVLEKGASVYLIEENIYQNTRNPSGTLIYPKDEPVNGKAWMEFKTKAQVTRDDSSFSVLEVPIGVLKTNTTYRAATYYGTKGRIDNDLVKSPIVTPASFPSQPLHYEKKMSLKLTNCE